MNLARTTAHALADSLRSEINGGHWPAGAALRQEDLAVRYGASRIPVREALGLLAAEGLITLEPNRGAYVATLDMAGVTEIFDLRQMLESSALRSAIPAHTPKTLAKLEAIQAQLAIEDEREGWLEGDRRFHDALYAPAKLPRTLAIIKQLRGQVERYLPSELGPCSRRSDWAEEHSSLIDAVRKRDEPRAVEVLTQHLRETLCLVQKAIQNSQTIGTNANV